MRSDQLSVALHIMNRQWKNQCPWMCPLLVGLVAAGLGAKQSTCRAADRSSAPAATRGIEREDDPAPVLAHYRAAWAVIVGINYGDLSGAAAAEIPRLGTAENDAQAIYDALTKNYGFRPERVRLLLGKAATRQAIENCFGDSFLGDKKQVKPDDCVLFYFAGHGNRREKTAAAEQFVGLLYPANVCVLPGKGADTITCLRIDDLLRYFQDYCAARHKLVLLDSCHSGEVFNFKVGRGAGVNRGFKPQLLYQPTFQAIAAARASQVAANAQQGGKHSPFTSILLEALEKSPFSRAPCTDGRRRIFTASELFAYVPQRMAEMEGANQDPQGGWLSGEGDFYFFPTGITASAGGGDGTAEIAMANGPAESRAVSVPASPLASLPADQGKTPLPPTLVVGMLAALLAACGGVLWFRQGHRLRSLAFYLAGATRAPSAVRAPANPAAPDGSGLPMIFLRVVGTPYAYQAAVEAQTITVGRQRRKPGQAAGEGNDLVIRVPDADEQSLHISRRHLEIQRIEDQWYVVDRSRVGTQLDGKALVTDQPAPLRSGSQLVLAGVIALEFLVQVESMAIARQPCVNLAPSAMRGMPIVMEASVGDMITVEP